MINWLKELWDSFMSAFRPEMTASGCVVWDIEINGCPRVCYLKKDGKLWRAHMGSPTALRNELGNVTSAQAWAKTKRAAAKKLADAVSLASEKGEGTFVPGRLNIEVRKLSDFYQ